MKTAPVPVVVFTRFVVLVTLAVAAVADARDLGVDVSRHQGQAGIPVETWSQMKAQGRSFAYIKATEGLLPPGNIDPAWAANVANANAAGMLNGVYHFARPDNRPAVSGAIQEADHFMTTAGSAIGPGHLRPVIDLERGNALSTVALTDWVLAFVNRVVEVKGRAAEPIVYCNLSYAASELDPRVDDLDAWIAYPSNPADPHVGGPAATGQFQDWLIWQYSFSGSVAGISPIDLNVLNNEEVGSINALVIPLPEPSACAIALLAALLVFGRHARVVGGGECA